MEGLFASLFSGPLGYIAVIVVLVLFVRSFTWHKDIKKETNPDEELGKSARKFFGLLNK